MGRMATSKPSRPQRLSSHISSDTVLRLLSERRNSAYKNNSLEQDHRGLKGRIRCMRGFKSFASAERFCRGYNELRNHLRLRSRHNQHVSADRRRAAAALVILQSA